MKKKLVVQLMGGLGNQLFQYAAGRSLALKMNYKLYLDVSFYSNDTIYGRDFELNRLPVFFDGLYYKSYEDRNFIFKVVFYLARRISFINNLFRLVLEEPYSAGNEKESLALYKKGYPYKRYIAIQKEQLGLVTYLTGYWQSDKYFVENAEEMRKEIAGQKNIVLGDPLYVSLSQANTICIGLRNFKDSEDSTGMFHPGEKYYKEAIACLKSKIKKLQCYVFTIDVDWAKSIIDPSINAQYIEPGADPVYDLLLMSCGTHFIIGNSTFHWWAAWLGSSENKMVIAPKNGWGNDKTVPENWITI